MTTFPLVGWLLKTTKNRDKEIIAAMRLVYERMKIVLEPSAAVSLAALLKHKELFAGKRMGVIFTGGNVELSNLAEWFNKRDR